MRLLHLSDPHFGTEQALVAEALLALANRLSPDALLISGDLTQRATAGQFLAARQWLKRLPDVPLLMLPGNHDIPLWNLWGRVLSPYAGYHRTWGSRPDGGVVSTDLPGARLIAVDTTRWWRHQNGTLSGRQIDEAGRLLTQAPTEAWRIVMTHHPLAVAHARDRADRPWAHAHALRAWQAAGADVLLSGHLHEPALLRVGPYCWLAQAGTSLSARLPAGVHNSVQLLVDVTEAASGQTPGRALIRYDYDPRRFEFLPQPRQALRARPAVAQTNGLAWAA